MPVMFNYAFDKVEGFSRPTLYPGEESCNWEVPENISKDFHQLNSVVENKYSKEFLKICAFYNKMFPSLKDSEWTQSTYNVQPFTTLDQERSDTGTGISTNYLKQIIDQVTSRLGTIQFIPNLTSEDQSLEYIVYKDEVERILRSFVRNDDFNRMCLESFHHGAVLGYSHVFIDPFTGKMMKANDYEIGIYESQLNKNDIKQALYRDYAFPTQSVYKYIDIIESRTGTDASELRESIEGKNSVDFKMYFDCVNKQTYITINNKTLPSIDYPFENVLIATFCWDTGFTKTTTTSLFDLLYPCQREINKINAKIQQLIRNYKGSIPVFNSDVDLAMKQITNGSGECLYVDSTRPLDSLMTVINPTPLDPNLSTQVVEYKTKMYELAGLQNMSFNMENMRSAAAVVALDQTRDAIFQAQLSAFTSFIKDALALYITFFAYSDVTSPIRRPVDWQAISTLVDKAYINLQPIHTNDALNKDNIENNQERKIDYLQLQTARTVLDIIKGNMSFNTLPYFMNKQQITVVIAATIVKFSALGIEIPDSVHMFLIDAFVEEVRVGNVIL